MANRNVYDMDKQKVALVLSMGGARGIAHIGVIEELLRHNFEITSIAGSSMGAMVGAMYASGKMEECKEWLYSWDKRKMWELADLTLSRDGLVKGDRFIKELKQIIPDMNIEDLPVPYVAMATDIVRDQEVRFDRGSLHEAIRASISIPMLFRPLRKDGTSVAGLIEPCASNVTLQSPPASCGGSILSATIRAPSAGLNSTIRRTSAAVPLTRSCIVPRITPPDCSILSVPLGRTETASPAGLKKIVCDTRAPPNR